MKIAACYIRVSTDDQLEYSPDSQLEAIKRYAKQNNLLLLPEYIFIERDGISGRKADKRPEFQHMIGIAKTKPKPFDVLLLWKFSRFARNREDSIVYKSMLRKQCGIDVISISEPVGDDKMSVIFEAMIEAMDEYYSINLAEEVKRGMTEAAKRGQAVSIAPFGYIIKDKKLIIDLEKADIVREVFNRYLNGHTQRQIALWLNDIGIRTKRGNVMENRTIDYWLNNPVYHGYIRWTPTGRTRRDFNNPDTMIIKGEHDAIISDDLWNAVQNKLSAQKAKYTRYAHSKPSDKFILSGVVKCATCGRAMVKTTDTYMRCTGYSHGQCSSSQCEHIQTVVDMLIIALEFDVASGNFNISAKKAKPNDNLSVLSKQIEREQKKLSRAKQAYLDGIDTAAEYKSNKKALQAEIDRLTAELDKLSAVNNTVNLSELPKRSSNLIDLLRSDAPNSEKNAALKSVIEKAVYNKQEKTLQLFYH